MKHRTNLEIAKDISSVRNKFEDSNLRYRLTHCVDQNVWLNPELDCINDTIDICCKLLGVILTLESSLERIQLKALQLELQDKAW